MLSKVFSSLRRMNYRLFGALLVLGLVPTVYTTVRIFFLGQLPGEWSFSIAGQLSWVNLLYEILDEAMILPLFYFVGKVKHDKKELSNRLRTGMILVFAVYASLSAIVYIFAEPMLSAMAVDVSIINESASYIRIEAMANVFKVLMQFALVVLVTVDKEKYLYILTAARLVLCILLDTFLVSQLSWSADLGVNGIGYSNLVVNVSLLCVSLVLLSREDLKVFSNAKLGFGWIKEFVRIGGISGVESFIRNVAYMVMVSRMVNVVGEQGLYWVANNFIWGWLLLPVLQLGELMKQEISGDYENIRRNTPGYFGLTAIIIACWLLSIPGWKPFMVHILGFSDVNKLFELVLLILGFYALYAIQNVFDSTFYAVGKTEYMLLESVVTNSIYYGTAFSMYVFGFWTPTLSGIALLFGLGNAFDFLVSLWAYILMLKKHQGLGYDKDPCL